MKISTKLALSAAMLVVCSPVSANAETAPSYSPVNIEKNNESVTPNTNPNNVPNPPTKSEKKNTRIGSKQSLLGIVSVFFVSIM
jgi:hypothetical protein